MTTLMPKWSLDHLLEGYCNVLPKQSLEIQALMMDSRVPADHALFLAVTGSRQHGLMHAQAAKANGAVAIIYDPQNAPSNSDYSVPAWPVPALTQRLGGLANRFYGRPSAHIPVVGVTGTDGKTSTSQFIRQILSGLHKTCGVIGTLGWGVQEPLQALPNTTPDAVTLQHILFNFVSQQLSAVAMEVSSHALALERVQDMQFHTAVFTNLGRDHLDFHGSVEAYAEAKRRLFSWPQLANAVVNADDVEGQRLLTRLAPTVNPIAYGLVLDDQAAQARLKTLPPNSLLASNVIADEGGLSFTVSAQDFRADVKVPLFGRFNIYNLLAAMGAVKTLGYNLDEIGQAVSHVRTVAGRMERLGGTNRPLVVVDYAHTPNALTQALSALRAHCRGKLWCVFGCGGERDAGKRPLMAAAAEALADEVILTSDNPRRESMATIISDTLAGFRDPSRIYVETDRAKAIVSVLTRACVGDIVLLAGKGHEDYQLIGDERLHFSDREQALSVLEALP